MKIIGNTETEKQNLGSHKNPMSIYDINIDRIEVSDQRPLLKKALNILLCTKMIMTMFMPLGKMLPKMSAHRGDFDRIKYMSFLVQGNKLLEKYNFIWDKNSNNI